MDKRCPRQLSSYPCQECIYGKNSALEIESEENCDWYINDQESNYCFWVWMNKNKSMECNNNKISQLLNLRLTTVYIIFNSAIEKLKKKIQSPSMLAKILGIKPR